MNSFLVGTITDSAKSAIEQAGGTIGPARIQPNIPAYLVTLPDTAKIAGLAINLENGITLHFSRSYQDREGTLDICI